MRGASCGDLGFINKQGRPCGQRIHSTLNPPGCLWHGGTPEQRKALSVRAGQAAKWVGNRILRREDFSPVPFTDREAVITYVQDLAKRVLTQKVDPRRIDSALKAAGVALAAFNQKQQEQITEALLKMEHGGQALVLLERLQVGLRRGRRRPLPGAPPANGKDAHE